MSNHKGIAWNTPRWHAKEAGERYYEGTPCRAGHTSRLTSNGACRRCLVDGMAAYKLGKQFARSQAGEHANPGGEVTRRAWARGLTDGLQGW